MKLYYLWSECWSKYKQVKQMTFIVLQMKHNINNNANNLFINNLMILMQFNIIFFLLFVKLKTANRRLYFLHNKLIHLFLFQNNSILDCNSCSLKKITYKCFTVWLNVQIIYHPNIRWIYLTANPVIIVSSCSYK